MVYSHLTRQERGRSHKGESLDSTYYLGFFPHEIMVLGTGQCPLKILILSPNLLCEYIWKEDFKEVKLNEVLIVEP